MAAWRTKVVFERDGEVCAEPVYFDGIAIADEYADSMNAAFIAEGWSKYVARVVVIEMPRNVYEAAVIGSDTAARDAMCEALRKECVR